LRELRELCWRTRCEEHTLRFTSIPASSRTDLKSFSHQLYSTQHVTMQPFSSNVDRQDGRASRTSGGGDRDGVSIIDVNTASGTLSRSGPRISSVVSSDRAVERHRSRRLHPVWEMVDIVELDVICKACNKVIRSPGRGHHVERVRRLFEGGASSAPKTPRSPTRFIEQSRSRPHGPSRRSSRCGCTAPVWPSTRWSIARWQKRFECSMWALSYRRATSFPTGCWTRTSILRSQR